MIKLHQLKKNPKSKHRRKVVGRGIGSGHGTYSTRGGKGQTARTGHSKMPVGFEGGRQPLIRQLPKNRGFRSPAKPVSEVSLATLGKAFPDGGLVNVATLKEKKLVPVKTNRAKIIGGGDIRVKLDVHVPVSASVKAAVLAAGGNVK